MATNPEPRPGSAPRSWQSLVARARAAAAPQVDVAAAVRTRLARENAAPVAASGWDEFARLFATVRVTGGCAFAAFAFAAVSLWQASHQIASIDPFWTYRLLGRLPSWAIHLFFS